MIDPTFKDDHSGDKDGESEIISYNLLFTGRSSENVVETQRNSQVEMRHEVDSKSLKPRSKEPTCFIEKDKNLQQNCSLKEKSEDCDNKLEEFRDSATITRRGSGINQRNRTNSMHMSKDNSLLCDYNQ